MTSAQMQQLLDRLNQMETRLIGAHSITHKKLDALSVKVDNIVVPAPPAPVIDYAAIADAVLVQLSPALDIDYEAIAAAVADEIARRGAE